MANPRQRRKARSSSHKAVSHSRHAKRNLKKTPPIRGPKVLQEAWDKQKTVRQNYASLGLSLNLNPSAHGGVELISSASNEAADVQDSPSSSSINIDGPPIPSGFGRIIRDEAGNISGFQLNQAEEQRKDPEPADMEVLEPETDANVRQRWVVDLSISSASNIDANGERVLKELTQISASATGLTTLSLPNSGVGSRHVSTGEIKYLEPLVKKYGSNIESMSRDRKLNPEQRTVGQLRRALKKSGLQT
ncbi:ribosome biogenesis protein Nop16 [Crassisporium funariophilum]|nr:ribosome biogenesis protein Nop16 [Crassisporium funariophilum]